MEDKEWEKEEQEKEEDKQDKEKEEINQSISVLALIISWDKWSWEQGSDNQCEHEMCCWKKLFAKQKLNTYSRNSINGQPAVRKRSCDTMSEISWQSAYMNNHEWQT